MTRLVAGAVAALLLTSGGVLFFTSKAVARFELRAGALAWVVDNVAQDVALPKGWARESVRVAFDIDPYSRELDSIFVTCGETSASAPWTT